MAVFTRNEARAYFEQAGLTYNDIHEGDILALVMMLNAMMKRTQKAAPETSLQGYWHLSRKITIKKRTNGAIRECYLLVNSYYFEQRECISFNRDGFIGFCGWADDVNTRPILDTFCAWVDAVAAAKHDAEGV